MSTNFELLTKKTTGLCISILSHQSTSTSSTTIDSSETVIGDLPTILEVRSDFIQLSKHLGKECTALTLACKPPLSLVAVEGTLNNIINLLLKFRVCLNACSSTGALAKEIRWIAYELMEAIQRLVESSLECHLAPTTKKASTLRSLNLALTGQVWEKVELASTSLSCTELEATRKDWKSVLDLLDDCLEEVKEMEEEIVDQDEGYGEGEDEEDEDDYRTNNPLSELERERVKAAHMLLRLGRLLLKRLITSTAPKSISKASASKTILPSTTSSSSSSTTITTSSPYTSSNFLLTSTPLVQLLSSTADDFAASLEPPQLLLTSTSIEFEKAGIQLSEIIEFTLIESNKITTATVVDGDELEEEKEIKEKLEKELKDEIRWLGMWRDQVGKARKKLLSLGVENTEVVVATVVEVEEEKDVEVVV